jgi:hypothetical protein
MDLLARLEEISAKFLDKAFFILLSVA